MEVAIDQSAIGMKSNSPSKQSNNMTKMDPPCDALKNDVKETKDTEKGCAEEKVNKEDKPIEKKLNEAEEKVKKTVEKSKSDELANSSNMVTKDDSQGEETIEKQLKTLLSRMNDYEKKFKQQNTEISKLKAMIKEKDREVERQQQKNQDMWNVKNRLKEKEKEIYNMKLEFNRNRSHVGDLQMSVKQIHNQLKSIVNNSIEVEDRLCDIERLSPKMGVFEWRIDDYTYHSQNAEYLCSPEFYTHLNGYCCYLSIQWFGNKYGRMGLYVHLNTKKNAHLVEVCKVNLLVQCVGAFGLSKDHVVHYDMDDHDSDSSICELDESIISADHYFLLKPFLDKYLIDDCLYFYVNMLSDPVLES